MVKNLLKKNELVKNAFILVQGTAAAQVITILMQPLLRRMFSTEDFGLFALYVSAVGVLSVMASGRYEMAILLPKEDKDAFGIFRLSIVISLIFNTILLIAIFFLSGQILDSVIEYGIVNSDANISLDFLKYTLYLIPFGVLVLSVYNSLNYYMTRKKQYKNLSTSRVVQTGSVNGVQVGFGAVNFGFSGLIIGQIIGFVSSILYIGIIKRKEFKQEKVPLRDKLKEYNDFPLKSVPSGLVNILAIQAPTFFIIGFFGLAMGGIYDAINKVLNIPLTMIGKSISQVFFQKITKDLNDGKNIGPYVKKFSIRLFLLMLIPMTIIFFFGEPLFAWYFGEEYALAGRLAAYFSIYFLVRFVYYSQSTLFSAKRKIGLEFRQNLLFLISQVSALLLGYYYFEDFEITFMLLALSGFLCYTIFVIQLIRTAFKPID